MAVALAANALVEVDAVLREFCVGGSDAKDDLLTTLVNTVSEAVTGPEGVNGPVIDQVFTKKFDGNDEDVLYVKPGPIRAIDSVTVDDVAVDPAGYEFEDCALYRLDDEVWTEGRRNVVMTYTAGIAADRAHVPEDIRFAVRMQIKHILTAIIEGRSQFAPEDVGAQNPRQYGLVPAVRFLLARYRN